MKNLFYESKIIRVIAIMIIQMFLFTNINLKDGFAFSKEQIFAKLEKGQNLAIKSGFKENSEEIHNMVLDVIKKQKEKEEIHNMVLDVIKKQKEKEEIHNMVLDVIKKQKEKEEIHNMVLNVIKKQIEKELKDQIEKERKERIEKERKDQIEKELKEQIEKEKKEKIKNKYSIIEQIRFPKLNLQDKILKSLAYIISYGFLFLSVITILIGLISASFASLAGINIVFGIVFTFFCISIIGFIFLYSLNSKDNIQDEAKAEEIYNKIKNELKGIDIKKLTKGKYSSIDANFINELIKRIENDPFNNIDKFLKNEKIKDKLLIYMLEDNWKKLKEFKDIEKTFRFFLIKSLIIYVVPLIFIYVFLPFILAVHVVFITFIIWQILVCVIFISYIISLIVFLTVRLSIIRKKINVKEYKSHETKELDDYSFVEKKELDLENIKNSFFQENSKLVKIYNENENKKDFFEQISKDEFILNILKNETVSIENKQRFLYFLQENIKTNIDILKKDKVFEITNYLLANNNNLKFLENIKVDKLNTILIEFLNQMETEIAKKGEKIKDFLIIDNIKMPKKEIFELIQALDVAV